MGNFEVKIKEFIEKLAKEKVGAGTFNQYSYNDPNNKRRRKNLRLYFKEICKFRPSYLLVSEAPGYLGARLTGVPFTSEFILLNGIKSPGIFGKKKGYRKTIEFDRECKEQSATIVWNAIQDLGHVPLFWPSFPFHPHKPNTQWSNRRPSPAEITLGQPFLKDVIAIFKIKKIVAVGRVAEKSLRGLGIECNTIRHPANGGARKFRKGLFREILG